MPEAYKKPAGVHAWVLRETLSNYQAGTWQCTKCGKTHNGEPDDQMLMEPCNPPTPPKPKGAA
jgi:hypothetical protein